VTKGTGEVMIEIVNLGATPPPAGAPEITSERTARIGVLQEFNYAITATDGTLTVDRAALTFAVDDKARTYGAANPALPARFS